MLSAFTCRSDCQNPSFSVGDPTWSLDLYLFHVGKLFFPSANLDRGGGSGILRPNILRFRQTRAFRKAQEHPRRFRQAAPESEVILLLRETTSGAASTGVADLEAAPEVAKTDGF